MGDSVTDETSAAMLPLYVRQSWGRGVVELKRRSESLDERILTSSKKILSIVKIAWQEASFVERFIYSFSSVVSFLQETFITLNAYLIPDNIQCNFSMK